MKKIWIVAIMAAFSVPALAQKNKQAPITPAPQGWHHLDMKNGGYRGISTEEAYNLLKGRKSETVVVAVIDDGVDVNHEDLKSVIWTNPKETDGNGKDDDNNGYVDDVHGWNFIGGKTADIDQDAVEMTRVYKSLKGRFEGKTAAQVAEADKADYARYVAVKKDWQKEHDQLQNQLDLIAGIEGIFRGASGGENMVSLFKVKDYLKTYKPTTKTEKKAKLVLKLQLMQAKEDRMIPIDLAFAKGKEQISSRLNYHMNPEFDPRASVVGDDYANSKEKIYGNNHVISHNGDHGTHVAGIIAGDRKNDIGMKGVADNVKIMAIRVVPDGDERDKDVANAIRYAADNGAKVVNMSFGKSYSWDKKVVDDAVKYAASKDVLLVHAAGNDAKNTDKANNFPKRTFEDGKQAENWLEIGASSWMPGDEAPARFSNYAQNSVDVFSPGVDIYSTVKDSKYDSYDGTSMASPVTAGIAALIRSYFPSLSAKDVKQIIIDSAIPYTEKVKIPGGKKKVDMKTLCRTGAIVNAEKAVKLAMERAK